MKLSAAVYQTLTPPQRVAAAVSALARDDHREIERLRETAARKTYRMADAEFVDTMEDLEKVSLALEVTLRDLFIEWLVQPADGLLQEIASGIRAWRETVAAMGIDADEAEAAFAPRSPRIAAMLGRLRTRHGDAFSERFELPEIIDRYKDRFHELLA